MLGTVVSLPLTFGWKIMAAVLIIVSCIYYCRQYQWLKSVNAIVKIEHDSQGKWTLHHINGIQYSKIILTSSYVIPNLVILHFNGVLPWQYRSVVIVVDAVDSGLFRQLRVYCRNPKTFQR